jgi:hypothetical protein
MTVSTSERTTDTRSMIRQPRPPPTKRGPSPPPKTIILIAAQSSALTWSPSSRGPVALAYRVAYPAKPLANPRPRTQFVGATAPSGWRSKRPSAVPAGLGGAASVEAGQPGMDREWCGSYGVRTLGGTRNTPGTPSVGGE